MNIPVEPKQNLNLKIMELVQGGEGLAKLGNFAIFVPQGIPGDLVNASIISVKPHYARALINKIIIPSDLRTEAPCPVIAACGGCQWQELQYEEQLFTKEHLLRDSLSRIGKIPEADLEKAQLPIIGMENPYYYRNKAQFPFGLENGKITGGFFAARSHHLVAIDKCYIQNEKINRAFRIVRTILKKYNISVYNEMSHKGFFRHLLIRHAFQTNQTLLVFVTNKGKFPQKEKIIESLKTDIPELSGIIQNINEKTGNTILGETNRLLYGNDYLIERLGDLQYKVSAPSFFQVNPVQAEKLYNTILKLAEFKGDEIVMDAYAGIGSIALWLARSVKEVHGIECSRSAVDDAIENCRLNQIHNCTFKLAYVEDIFPNLLIDKKIDTVILDPPRKGCQEYMFATLHESQVKKIIYVSCNPSTLARDSKLLYENGFTLKAFQAVDMFPHTYHLETVALFVRNEG